MTWREVSYDEMLDLLRENVAVKHPPYAGPFPEDAENPTGVQFTNGTVAVMGRTAAGRIDGHVAIENPKFWVGEP